MDANAFIPKQCPERTPLVLSIVQGDVTQQVARHALNLVPDIASSSIIHEKACGTGPVMSIVASSPSPPQKLHATDIAPVFVQIVAQKDAEKKRILYALNNNFYIQAVPETHRAMAEIYKTLKPEGTAVIKSWAPVPHVATIKGANARTRGEGSPLFNKFKPENYTIAFLVDIIGNAGFTVSEHDVSVFDCIRRLGGSQLSREDWCDVL
ncbi:hypothetical protein K491DRAFT_709973 [Lophiostoma macrostomum CBS 122681]|uniref:S-adenosyl-L-methionine-dependent methyltransferase n=1 Tax=Lophiostoma macrostomum CBS 122681 TaxID=1314788 RepID=A0A6A6TT55_9PLEO|nr:hypothetical protein K491DRAFT_709973 [Lophiostoma macrostomum CBS 122681]